MCCFFTDFFITLNRIVHPSVKKHGWQQQFWHCLLTFKNASHMASCYLMQCSEYCQALGGNEIRPTFKKYTFKIPIGESFFAGHKEIKQRKSSRRVLNLNQAQIWQNHSLNALIADVSYDVLR